MLSAVQADPFWPATLTGWLPVLAFFLGTVVTTLSASWRWLMRPIVKSIEQECRERRDADNGIGGRTGRVEDRVTRNEERLNMLERAKELAEERNQRLERDVGGVEQSVKALADTVTALERERLAQQGEIRERLAELNGKLDLIAQMNTTHK
jgi:predicted  nucleic acid-binding Zn-ribbon protein